MTTNEVITVVTILFAALVATGLACLCLAGWTLHRMSRRIDKGTFDLKSVTTRKGR